ncbi:MAG TPA: hypothetical protein PLO14_02360 [Accumulibacter sp.]|uniref:hypothetical protein n=1 Tax=Accumulibacter sp. TaxID=2053492 RepID=UPI0025E8FE4C|nr:hypothetical protein [Accumulibacter sp.]MCM8597045.1 hypothetical protein [Accumulibacter sp.]MCM8663674.1 hypothetical protein [Accumulibacter sp.]HNC51073.1 hypothetical protein [Accumulibacter sp.]
MNPIIPDTLEGALILSLIDFFLSFVVISFIGVVLAGFPLLNRIGDWVAARAAVPTPTAKKAAPLPPPQPPPAPIADQEIPIEDVVAIAAAIAAMVGEHRILHIEPQQRSGEWSTAGRLEHHHSHLPTRQKH